MKKSLIIGIVIAVIIVAAILFMFNPFSKDEESSTAGTLTSTDTPTKVYLDYKNEFDAAEDFDSYLIVVEKYATEFYISQVKDSENLEEHLKESIFMIEKELSPAYEELDIDNIQEKIRNNDKATLTINTKDGTGKGTISMIIENGSWKLQEDFWEL